MFCIFYKSIPVILKIKIIFSLFECIAEIDKTVNKIQSYFLNVKKRINPQAAQQLKNHHIKNKISMLTSNKKNSKIY